MNILVLNSGSSSLKFQLFKMPENEVLAKGICERIGQQKALFKFEAGNLESKIEAKMPTHKEAISLVLDAIEQQDLGSIDAIGHRVVHGGEYFSKSVEIDEDAMSKIKELVSLAPLHNPPAILGIEICQEMMPNVKNIAVFDTAFHQSMPEHAFMYALPYKDYEELRVRKYGFHGTSHKYVSQEATKLLAKQESNVIVCHLGNGSSVTAIKNGEVIDTSMGLTPLQGLMMGTRSGDLDPAVVFYIMQKRGFTPEQMSDYLNKKSGILGVFEKGSDMREVEDEYFENAERAKLTVEMLAYRIKLYVGSYIAALGGVDALCFTGGIGENSDLIRALVCNELKALGLNLDEKLNNGLRARENTLISKEDSAGKIFVIPTNEEYMIAKDTFELA